MKALQRVRIILVEPASSGNIGAVARVMKNTGLQHLALVSPKPDWDTSETRAFAHGAGEILDGVHLFSTLQDAVSDCHLVIGTTHRKGKQRDAIYPPQTMVEKIQPYLADSTTAIVFGREKDGLWQDELRYCQYLVRFPSAVLHPSYNLSHAVLLFAYALFSASSVETPAPPEPLAPHAERERLYAQIEGALKTIGFKHYNQEPQHFNRVMRRFFNRVDLSVRDIRVFLKICNEIRRFSRRMQPDSTDPPAKQ